MMFRRLAFAAVFASTFTPVVMAQSAADDPAGLFLELNTVQDVDGACRLTFVARNQTGTAIDKAVFETVIFDATGTVVSLSLFNFRELPTDRPRVRQFILPGMSCDTVGQALINGASSCVVNGSESEICREALSLSSRVDMELLG
ncbi:hypothetical protein HW561_00160 [Rhodobacteraceae bacterium B1Z28]|uniref:Tat pathway signal sequence domain protein n=1 Tax=Ruegeria haliotis TaxID=2747601 RepID=A0ABX2PJD2_9RHOB|nr:hypothetical protein [Ruegeria haliotis]NVO54204.1 hypothetical protein [Ruegeria haliotis]